MDEFNPISEYAPIDDQENTTATPTEPIDNDEALSDLTQPVMVENAENKQAEISENEQNKTASQVPDNKKTYSRYNDSCQSQQDTSQNLQNQQISQDSFSQPQDAANNSFNNHNNTFNYQSAQYTQPQYPSNRYSQPQYTGQQYPYQAYTGAQYQPPQYQPARYTAPQNINLQYQPPQYQPPQQKYGQPQQQYQPPQQQYNAQNNNQQYNSQQGYTQPQGAGFTQPPQAVQNPYQQMYTQPNPNPYAQQYQPNIQPHKTAASTKVFIGIICGLLAIFLIGFIVYLTNLANKNLSSGNNPLLENYSDYFSEYYDFGSGSNGYGSFGQSYDHDEFEEDIILQADEGETQQKSDDKTDNSAKPDKNAEGITLKKLPENAGSKDYSSQTAYDTVADSVVGVICYKDEITGKAQDIISEGTGTIISADGYIVTNSHVIGDSKMYTINISLNNAKEYKAKVVGYDSRTDLAVLKIDANGLTPAQFGDSSLVKVGQDIVAIGNPGGTSFQNSLTKGIVSAVDREIAINKSVRYIQIDAAINPGNSGGPLCNIYGQVIGINTAKISSSTYEGMGFAIPSETVQNVANDLIHYGYVKNRVRLGLTGTAVTSDQISAYGVPSGIIVSEIDKNGPLADTDIKTGDIITAVDGEEVSNFQDVYAILAQHKPGDKVTISVYRLEKQ